MTGNRLVGDGTIFTLDETQWSLVAPKAALGLSPGSTHFSYTRPGFYCGGFLGEQLSGLHWVTRQARSRKRSTILKSRSLSPPIVAYGSYLLANHLHLSGVIATASA